MSSNTRSGCIKNDYSLNQIKIIVRRLIRQGSRGVFEMLYSRGTSACAHVLYYLNKPRIAYNMITIIIITFALISVLLHDTEIM